MSAHHTAVETTLRIGLARGSRLGRGLTVIGASALIAASAQIAVPGLVVPTTMQSLAVLAVGSVLGPHMGAAAVLLYLGEGACGLPVFANFSGTLVHLTGSTGGYLVSFVPAAWLAGYLARGERGNGVIRPFLNYLLGHTLILGVGTAYLALAIGPARALAVGLAPFVLGSVVKSMLGATLSEAVRRLRPTRAR